MIGENSTQFFSGDQAGNPIFEMIYQYWNSAILRTGVKLGLFDLIEQNNFCSAEFIAGKLETDLRFTEIYLDCCMALELLTKDGERYQNSPASSTYLVPSSPAYMGDLVLHITNHWRNFERLEAHLRSGKHESPYENGFIDKDTYWRDYMAGQHARAVSGQAEMLVSNAQLHNKRFLIDLGGGMGSYTVPLCQFYPELKAELVDVKEALAQAALYVARSGLSDRIELIEGSIESHTKGVKERYDSALLSGVAVIHSEDRVREIFALAHHILVRGGVLLVQDSFKVGGMPERKLMDTLHEFYLKIAFTEKACNHNSERIVELLKEVGFQDIKVRTSTTQLSVIRACK